PQREMLHVPDEPDDLADFFSVIVSGKPRLDPFSDDVLSGEIFLRETLVYDHDGSGVEPITLIENTASPDGDAHRLEIIRRDDSNRSGRSLALGERTLLDIKRGPHVVAAQRQRQDYARRFDAGNAANSRQKHGVECDGVFVFRVGYAGRSNAGGEEPLAAHAGLDTTEPSATLAQQAGR